VRVTDPKGRLLGSGIASPTSQIRIRLFSPGEAEFDAALIRQRVVQSVARRAGRPVARVVWSEADGLPGLVVDRYDDIVVFQILHAAVELQRDAVIDALRAALQPRVLIERSDAPVRRHESLESRVEVVTGAYDSPTRHTIGDAVFELNLLTGQKTGAYLDQADNYRAVAARAKGRRVLDMFSNAGGFALHAAKAGAASVEAVESSGPAVAESRRNASLNGVGVTWHEADAFDFLRQATQEKRQYDLVVLDPPSFAKTKEHLRNAVRGYHDLHVRAFRLLREGGVLATFTCSHHVSWEGLVDIARSAAVDVRRSARIVARLTQAVDHPVLLGMPESEYLRGLILEIA
jgi:23S rRNA (cytosine1962-C5)-methyltransferase